MQEGLRRQRGGSVSTSCKGETLPFLQSWVVFWFPGFSSLCKAARRPRLPPPAPHRRRSCKKSSGASGAAKVREKLPPDPLGSLSHAG